MNGYAANKEEVARNSLMDGILEHCIEPQKHNVKFNHAYNR